VIDDCRLDVDEIDNAVLRYDRIEPVVDGDALPNRIGVQLGGSAYFQIVYRTRLEGPLFFDVGFFAQPHVANGSMGLLDDRSGSRRLLWPMAGLSYHYAF
jgi:hypothetical protein